MIDFAVITAGGEGKRMKNSGIDIPKPLVKVNGKPLINYIIDSLIANKIKKIIIIEPWNNSIKQELKKYYSDINLIFIKPLKSQKLFYNLLLTQKYINKRFILSDADIIINKEILKKFLNNKSNSFGKIATVKYPKFQNNQYLSIKDGNIIAFNKDGSIDGYHGGFLYQFETKIFNYISDAIKRNDLSFSNLITYVSSKEKIIPVFIDDIWDVDNNDDLVKTEKYLNKD